MTSSPPAGLDERAGSPEPGPSAENAGRSGPAAESGSAGRGESAARGGPKGRVGLRERKKARTRAAIRTAAMDLFEEQGYASTTVEQIAEAAEVSPSTFFRYFPTKEDVVLADDWDAPMIAAIRAQPPGTPPAEALVAGMRSVVGQLTPADREAERRRQRLFFEVPELRARYLQQITDAIELFAAVLAERSGKPAPDLESRAVAGAMIGVAIALVPHDKGMIDAVDIDTFERAIGMLRQNLHVA